MRHKRFLGYACENWTIKKAEQWRIDNFRMMVLEKTFESSLDSKEIKPVNLKRINPEDQTLEGLTLKLKLQFFGEDPAAGKDWGQEEKGVTEDEMFGWHHRLNGHEFEQTLGDGEGQGGLACCSPWGSRVRHALETEQLWYKLMLSCHPVAS